jgi:hypothetical protein
MIYRNRSAAQSILRISGEVRTFGHFSRMSQIYQKNAKKSTKKQYPKPTQTHKKFSVFCKNRTVTECEGYERMVEETTQILVVHTFQEIFPEGCFRVQTFNRIEGKNAQKKGRFFTCFENFVFSFTSWRSNAFCIETICFRFFYRGLLHFRFWVPILVLFLLSKIRPGQKKQRLGYPIGPCCAGGGQFRFFCSDSDLRRDIPWTIFAVLLWGWKWGRSRCNTIDYRFSCDFPHKLRKCLFDDFFGKISCIRKTVLKRV